MRTKSISTTCGLLVFALSVGACSQKRVSSSPKATNPASEVSAAPETGAASETESIEVVITDQPKEDVIAVIANDASSPVGEEIATKGGFGDLRMAEAQHEANAQQQDESATAPSRSGFGELRVAEAADEAKAKRARLAQDYSRRFNVMEDQTNKIEFGINFWAVAGTAVATGILAEKAERISQVLARASDSFAATMRRMPDDFQERMDKLNKLAREASEAQTASDTAKKALVVGDTSYAQAEKNYLDSKARAERLSRGTSNIQVLSTLQDDVGNAQTAFNQFKAQVTDGQIQELRRLERAALEATTEFQKFNRTSIVAVTKRIQLIGESVADVFNSRATRLRSMEGAAKVQRIIVTGGSILVIAAAGKLVYDIGFDEDSVVIHAKVIEELKKDNPGYESVIDTLKLN
jgi:hypothetical protein